MIECDPTKYVLKEDHERHCADKMHWAETVVSESKDDRGKLWNELEKIDREVVDLARLVPRFQWWFIGLLLAVIISSYIMPKVTNNGTHKALSEISQKVSIIGDTQIRHEKISDDNNNRLENLEKRAKVK